MDADEEAGTTASLDHIIARLQTLEAADQVPNASDFCAGQLALRRWWNAEFVFAGRPTRGPSLVPGVGRVTGAVCTAPATLLASNKKGWEGGATGGPTVVLREFQAFAPTERGTRYFFEPATRWICARMTKDPTTSTPSAMKFKVVASSESVLRMVPSATWISKGG